MLSSLPLLAGLACFAQAVSVNVKSTNGNATSPYAYALMFEDINNSGDGGVYAELVQNRAFQGNNIYPSTLDSYKAVGGASLALQNLSTPLSSALPTSMRVTGSGDGVGFLNEGFWGFPVVADWTYTGSFYVHGSYNGNVSVNLKGNFSNQCWAEASVQVSSTANAWTQYNYTFKPAQSASESNNTLVFTWDASGETVLDFNLISLFPPTYKDRPNGLRIDLMEAMADLKPTLFRAPGGNNVEGNASPYWWNWTQTIGPLEQRPGFPGTWGYQNTDGLGLLEYMLWAEDIGMTLSLAVWSGLYLDDTVIPEDELGVYVQAALDEIEFLTGAADTTWGAIRASLGYPNPFDIKFVEVGNEDSLQKQGGPTYRAYRFKAFYDAIHAAYPDITIIASFYDVEGATPPFGAAGDFHEYALPSQMASQFTYFDNYTSANPILIGEYAAVEPDAPGRTSVDWYTNPPRWFTPAWYSSVAEAIFLLGAERNSDKIIGACYAPMFQNFNKWEWIPNLMSFDANPVHTTLSTSYHIIRLLSGTKITENLPMEGAEFGPAFYVAGRSSDTGSHIFKAAVYNATEDLSFDISFEGVRRGAAGILTYLTAPMNASQPIGGNIVETHTEYVRASWNGSFCFDLPPYSVGVFEVKAAGRGWRGEGWKGHKHW